MGFLAGKRALIIGIASNKSIAWGIAQAMHREGAELALTYQNDRLKSRVEKFATELDSQITAPLDVQNDDDITNIFETLGKHWDGIDIIVHAVGFAPADQVSGDFVDNISREGFQVAHDISSYSFAALAKAGKSMLLKGNNPAMLTLSYLGAEKAIPNYNTMGLAKASLEASVRYMAESLGPHGTRVNAISAGAIRTLAASGIQGFRKVLSHIAETSPIRRNVTQDDVGNAAAFLCSDLASGITGQIVHVDGGFSSVGLNMPETDLP